MPPGPRRGPSAMPFYCVLPLRPSEAWLGAHWGMGPLAPPRHPLPTQGERERGNVEEHELVDDHLLDVALA